jgi:hypothetical protein
MVTERNTALSAFGGADAPTEVVERSCLSQSTRTSAADEQR